METVDAMREHWPATPEELVHAQERLGQATPEPWAVPEYPPVAAGCFVCFGRGESGAGHAGDEGWAAAVALHGRRVLARSVVHGAAGAAYEAGLLALREGPLLEAAVRRLGIEFDVLLVNATGRDHPRRAGLAVHLGAVLGVPSVGVTHRPLLAEGDWPEDVPGASSPLAIRAEVVGYWLRTRAGKRPLAIHAGWRTTPDVALEVIRRVAIRVRTPEPIRQARKLARLERAHAG